MKLYLLLFITTAIGLTSYSQEETTPKVKNWTVKSIVLAQPYSFEKLNFIPTAFTGIGLKRNFDNLSIRFSLENMNYKSTSEELNGIISNYNQELTARIGAEYKRKHLNTIELNIFLDFAISKYELEQKQEFNTFDLNYLSKSNGIATGGIIGIGIDYYLFPSFSLFLETRLDLLFFSEDRTLIRYQENTSVSNRLEYSNLNLKILGNFGFNYHF